MHLCVLWGGCHIDVIVAGTFLRLGKAVMLGYQLHFGEQKLFTIIWNSYSLVSETPLT